MEPFQKADIYNNILMDADPDILAVADEVGDEGDAASGGSDDELKVAGALAILSKDPPPTKTKACKSCFRFFASS